MTTIIVTGTTTKVYLFVKFVMTDQQIVQKFGVEQFTDNDIIQNEEN